MKEVVEKLILLKKTISVMESCTGGGISNSITNIPGASDVIEFGAVTYSNRFKEKMGVSSEIISKYSVYSMQVAQEMSKNIAVFSESNYGIGITGKLNRVDKNNLHGSDHTVYISIYDKDRDQYFNKQIEATLSSREKNKNEVILMVQEMLLELLR